MSDLFHDGVSDDYWLRSQELWSRPLGTRTKLLTKLSARMREMLKARLNFAADQPHIWWGVSVENKPYGIPRVAHLQSAPVSAWFLSIEPLLEDLGELIGNSLGDWAARVDSEQGR